MELKMPVVLAIVGVVCAVLALIFQIVGVATAAWVTSDSTDAGSGLWKSCVGGTCFDLSDFLELRGEELPDWMLVCRVFGILGILVLAGCVLVGVVRFFVDNKKVPVAAAALGFVAGICILVEFVVYVSKGDLPKGFGLDYSFGLTVVACVFGIAAGIFFIVSKLTG